MDREEKNLARHNLCRSRIFPIPLSHFPALPPAEEGGSGGEEARAQLLFHRLPHCRGPEDPTSARHQRLGYIFLHVKRKIENLS